MKRTTSDRSVRKTVVKVATLLMLISTFATAQQFGPWSGPTNLGPLINAPGFNTQHPAISKDGLSLYITTNRPGGPGDMDIWVSHRDTPDGTWNDPVPVPNINSAFGDAVPNLSIDGHWMYFHSNRPTWLRADGVEVPTCGQADLYVSHRRRNWDDQHNPDDSGWELPVNLGCAINTTFSDNGPTYFHDETTGNELLYFTRLNDPLAQQICGSSAAGDFDIFLSKRAVDGTWGTASPECDLSSSARDTRTAIRRDGLEMFIASQRPGYVPGGTDAICGKATGNRNPSGDLWVSTRLTTLDRWSPPVNIDHDYLDNGSPPIVNSECFDGAPALSFDATTLFFFSFRPRPGDPSWDVNNPTANLYVTTRTKLPDRIEPGVPRQSNW
jgi:hypothetical protein